MTFILAFSKYLQSLHKKEREKVKSFKFILGMFWVVFSVFLSCNRNVFWDSVDSTKNDVPSESCINLECQVVQCLQQGTTVSGKVTIPNGAFPLYNARVYVPNSPVGPLVSGATCDRCDLSYMDGAVTATTTDAAGNFVLQNVPVGTNIPLVVVIGRWRRQLILPQVQACVDNAVPPEMTRLPRNSKEGDIPKIAVTTGSADAIECLLRKIGLDDSEFTPETATGRINLYNGEGGASRYAPNLNGGVSFTAAPAFWESFENLKTYDLIIHSCEGIEYSTNKSLAARQALKRYVDSGGRVFASHWHNYWVENGPDSWSKIATFNHRGDLNNIIASVDTSSKRSQAFADWLTYTDASFSPGNLLLFDAKNTVLNVDSNKAQAWISYPSGHNIQYFSFNAPIDEPATQQCGRFVLTDIHVSAGSPGDTSSAAIPFPIGCSSQDFSPQEKALIFMLFDVVNCLQPIPG